MNPQKSKQQQFKSYNDAFGMSCWFLFFFFYIKDASFTVAEVNWFLIYLLFCAYYFFPENFGLVNLIKSYKHNNNSSIYRCLDNLKAVIFGDPASDSPLLLYSY